MWYANLKIMGFDFHLPIEFKTCHLEVKLLMLEILIGGNG